MLHEQPPLGGTLSGLLCLQRGTRSRHDALACFGPPGASEPEPHVCSRQGMPTYHAAGRSAEHLEDA